MPNVDLDIIPSPPQVNETIKTIRYEDKNLYKAARGMIKIENLMKT